MLFGGYDGAFLGDSWTFGTGGWQHIRPQVSPQHREYTAACFDGAIGSLVAFGGTNGVAFGDTWWG
jgi:hypothetical protein